MTKAFTTEHTKGFTLIEFLICLVLFSMILLVLTQARSIIFGSWLHLDRKITVERELNGGLTVLSRQIRSMVPFNPYSAKRKTKSIAITASSKELVFVTSQSIGSRAQPGMWFVRYSYTKVDGFGALLITEWPIDKAQWSNLSQGISHSQAILLGLKNLKFKYLRIDPLKRKPAYFSSWPFASSGELPMIVQMEFYLDKKKRVWEIPVLCGGN